ncbi:MAG: DNA topoisomerase IB, partial [Verrucomicrobiota bacterium]
MIEARQSAEEAGLHYVTDAQPGIRRLKQRKAFAYFTPAGERIRDPKVLQRIKALAIPPAWTEVWICPSPNGHLQATGRDARGRKQYRYHSRWRIVRDETKYDRLLKFARILPRLRRRLREHLKLPGLPREKVLATVVTLLERTLIRVGNDEYASTNHSYGLTTLQDRHARVSGGKVQFQFRGKSGKKHFIDLNDPLLARIVRRCRDLPGAELFQYVDKDGRVQDIGSTDVNEYLRQISGCDFTAKDFRTWFGSVLALLALTEIGPAHTESHAKKNIVKATEAVAATLGNTVSVCRKCYIHPAVVETYLRRELFHRLVERG